MPKPVTRRPATRKRSAPRVRSALKSKSKTRARSTPAPTPTSGSAKANVKRGRGFVAAKLKAGRAGAVMKKGPAQPVMVARRADLNAPGEVAINRLPAPKRAVAKLVHALLLKLVPGTTSVVKWGNACYSHEGVTFAVLYETKAGINLGLPGANLPDPHKLLEGTGKKMRHIKLATKADAEHPGIPPLVRAARKIGFEGM